MRFNNKIAYLIGWDHASDEPRINWTEHLGAARVGLMNLGFKDEDITMVRTEDERIPDFEKAEVERIIKATSLERVDDEDKTFVVLYFKGPCRVRDGCVEGVSKYSSSRTVALEGFLRRIAQEKTVYALGLFDCCRKDQEGN